MTASPDGEALDAIYGAWSRYKNAVLDGDGEAAAAEVSPGIISYFDEVRHAVLYMPETTLRSLPLIDKSMVLSVRTSITAEELVELDGRALYVKDVCEGLTLRASVRLLELGSCISVEGDTALMKVHSAGSSSPMPGAFLRMDGAWKVDMLSLLKLSARTFEEHCASTTLSRDDFVISAISSSSGKDISSVIWQPLLDGPEERKYDYLGAILDGDK